MAGSYKKSPHKDRQAPPTELQQQIEEQTAAFLKRGGEIQYIRNGVSGQVFSPVPRQAPAQGHVEAGASAAKPSSK